MAKSIRRNPAKVLLLPFFVLIFFLIISLVGCKTTKQVDKLKQQTTTEANLSTESNEKSKLKVNEFNEHSGSTRNVTSDKTTTDETVEETTTKTKFSAPDSTGKQYPTETEITNRKTKRGEKKNMQTSSESQENNAKKLTDNSESEKAAKTKDKGQSKQTQQQTTDKKTEVETPGWITIVAVISIVGVLLFVYLILKRYKLIK